jgi:hypothetical protein
MKTLGTGVGIFNINFQIGSLSEISFIFSNQNGVPIDISGWSFEFFVKKNKGAIQKDISKTIGNGISFPIYVSNQINLSFVANIEEGEYVWELRRTDLNKPLIAGLSFFTFDPKQGNTQIDSSIINESITVDVVLSGASGQSISGSWSLQNGGSLTGDNIISTGLNDLTFSVGSTNGNGLTIIGNSLTTGNLLDISSSSVTSGNLLMLTSTSNQHNHVAGSNGLINLLSNGANANSGRTTIGFSSIVSNTGTASTNVAGYFQASGGTNNYAGLFNGKVGINRNAPTSTLELAGDGAAQIMILRSSTLTGVYTLSNNGLSVFSPQSQASGNSTGFTYTQPANTNQTASTEELAVNWNLSATVQFATGALSLQRAFMIKNPTYSFVGSSTISDAYTFYVDNSPVAGTNATITRRWAGFFGGRLRVTEDVVIDAVTKGLLLKDSNNNFWRLIVDTAGTLTTESASI